MSGRSLPALLCASVVCIVGGARGQSAADEPEDHFRRGDRLARERKYQEALDAWRRGYLDGVPRHRGLEFRFPVPAGFMERDRLRAFVLENLAEELPDEKISRIELAYEHLGLFERGFDLKATMVELWSAAIAGFYDPDAKKLYLVRPAAETGGRKRGFLERLFTPGAGFNVMEQRSVLSHELAHALADQHYDLHSMLQSVIEDDDMALALQALVEGEATMVMLMDMLEMQGGDGRVLLRGASSILDAMLTAALNASVSVAASAGFARAPPILRESITFPYTRGFALCNRLTTGGEWAPIDAAFRDPPVSTEQLLHPEKYIGEGRDEPVEIILEGEAPLGGGWELVYANVLGEFGTEVLFRATLGGERSTAAAAGWDGDLFHVYAPAGTASRPRRDGGDGGGDGDGGGADGVPRTLLVWITTWDSEDDATEFAGALAQLHGGEPDPSLPERTWERDGLASGIWRAGADVWFLDAVPAARLDDVRAWSRRLERRPKEFRLEKHPTTVELTPEGRRARL